MTEHTLGPWRLDRTARGAGFSVVAASPKRAGGGNRICTCRPASYSPEAQDEAEANARLIAAAPEMLETLKDVSDFLKRSGYDTKLVRAAIAKAEGRS